MKTVISANFLRAVSLAVTGCLAATVLVVLAQRVGWRFPLENFEGACVDAASNWRDGRPLYADVSKGELPVYNYPPLYFWIVGGWRDVARPFLPGRLVSAAALLCAAFWAGFFVYRTTGKGLPAVWAACFFMTIPENAFLGALVRPDTTAALLSLAAMVLGFYGYPDKRSLAAAAVLGVAGLFTKQTALAGPAALMTWLLLTDRKAAWWFGSVFVLAAAAAIGVAEWITSGLFVKNVVGYSVTDYAFGRLRFFLTQYLSVAEPIHIPVVAAAAIGAAAVARRGWRDTPLLPYLALTALSLAALGKDGASRLYFFEFHLAAAMTAGVGIDALTTANRRVGSALLAAVSLGSCVVAPYLMEVAATTRTVDTDEQQLVELMRGVDGPVLAEDAGYAVVAGRRGLEMTNPFLVKRLVDRGLVDLSPYLAKVRAEWYAAIVLDSPAHSPSRTTWERYPVPLLTEIAARYRPVRRIGERVIYRPRLPAAPTP